MHYNIYIDIYIYMTCIPSPAVDAIQRDGKGENEKGTWLCGAVWELRKVYSFTIHMMKDVYCV